MDSYFNWSNPFILSAKPRNTFSWKYSAWLLPGLAVQTTRFSGLSDSSHPYSTFFSVAYSRLQTGNWVCEQTETPVKECLSCLIKVRVFTGLSPLERLEQVRSGLTGPGWTKTETIGVWWMDPDSLSLSETCSESLGVNLTQCQHGLARPLHIHTEVRGHTEQSAWSKNPPL